MLSTRTKFIIQSLFLIAFATSAFASYTTGSSLCKWACVHSKPSLFSILSSRLNMIVLDPDDFTASEISLIHSAKIKVFAYLSIGEAEKYRSYFTDNDLKKIIICENKNWAGNYRVKYWTPIWKKIIGSYSKSILDKGFDGLYLDVVDAWESFSGKEKLYRLKMINFLIDNARKWKSYKPKVKLFFQNSHELFEDKRIVAYYDGIVQEGLFADWTNKPVNKNWQTNKIIALEKIKKQGKFVGILEYTLNKAKIRKILNIVKKLGFCVYFSDKNLTDLYTFW